MKRLSFTGVCAAVLIASSVLPTAARAGPIDRACRQSSRAEATAQLCSCIQGVANDSLSQTEMRQVAKWFDDPHQAQVVRQSTSDNDTELWRRYKAFGERALQVCG